MLDVTSNQTVRHSPKFRGKRKPLYCARQQLSLDPSPWKEDIQPTLMEIINNNPSLNTAFQNINSKLEKIDEILQNFIPNTEEMKTVPLRKINP